MTCESWATHTARLDLASRLIMSRGVGEKNAEGRDILGYILALDD